MRTLILVVIALLPALLSVFYSTADAKPLPISGEADRPALAFAQYLVDYPRIMPTHIVSANYTFKNTSDVTVTIKELKPSCGCLQPRLIKGEHTYAPGEATTFEPGESGSFSLRLETDKKKAGQHELYCDVIYEDAKPRETRVVFKVKLPEKKVTVSPPAVMIYQSNERRTTHSLKVNNYTDQRLDIVGVECSNDLVQVAIGDTEFDHKGKRLHNILVSVAKVPSGRHLGNITISTTHPVHKEIVVPIRVDGPIKADE